ncbi:unnamed protein product [Rotaria sordida]|uniref:Uncharacterized protein n=1 Tax=Rotaria sordida TaxID=392033 RepID=A0A814LQ71_9BILA|nr:unnamed protein product [Rotaria sordida]
MSSSDMNWAISLFYLSYSIFEIPGTLLLRFLGPTRYLSLSLILWGGITVGMAFVKNSQQLLIVRFLLAYGTRHMKDIGGLKNWRWLFLLEGLPIIPLGVMTYLFLGSIPDTVQWLDNCEKQLLTNLLREDAGLANSEPTSSTRLSWRQVRYVFIDWRIYLYVMIAVGDLAVHKCLTTYLPELAKPMSDFKEVHLMTIPLDFVACICCLLAGYSSSCRNEHSFHLAFCLSIALLGFILMITLYDQGNVALYVSTCIAYCGAFSAFPLLLSWLTNNVGGHTKRALAVGFLVGMAQMGGALAPLVYPDDDEPVYRRGHIICGGIIAISLIITFILRNCLQLENDRRIYLSPDKYKQEAAIIEPCDWHPDIRYVL